MDCAGIEELLPAYLDGELLPEQVDFVEQHLETCRHCDDLLRHLRSADELIAHTPSDVIERLPAATGIRPRPGPADMLLIACGSMAAMLALALALGLHGRLPRMQPAPGAGSPGTCLAQSKDSGVVSRDQAVVFGVQAAPLPTASPISVDNVRVARLTPSEATEWLEGLRVEDLDTPEEAPLWLITLDAGSRHYYSLISSRSGRTVKSGTVSRSPTLLTEAYHSDESCHHPLAVDPPLTARVYGRADLSLDRGSQLFPVFAYPVERVLQGDGAWVDAAVSPDQLDGIRRGAAIELIYPEPGLKLRGQTFRSVLMPVGRKARDGRVTVYLESKHHTRALTLTAPREFIQLEHLLTVDDPTPASVPYAGSP